MTKPSPPSSVTPSSSDNSQPETRPVSRRQALKWTAMGGLACGVSGSAGWETASGQTKLQSSETEQPKLNRVKQSVMAWCFRPMAMEELIPACAKMGLVAMEGIDPKYYPLMKQHGLGVSLCSSHGFAKGPVNPENVSYCREQLLAAIDRAVAWNCKNVITFTGMRESGINDKQATKNCIELWKSVIGRAESQGITLVLEHLNSRDDTHPMKGHPGYFGDDVDQCIDMIKAVDSPNIKLLFDIYHVQIMNGDVIRRFRTYQDLIGHVHTAGVPGRAELDENQELNYPAIIRAIMETGYEGYIVQEFIPTWDDKLAALRHGVKTCNV